LAACAFVVVTVPASAHVYNVEKEGEAKASGHRFILGGATVECEESVYKWTQKGKSETFAVTPEYKKCKSTGLVEVEATVTVKCSAGLIFGKPTEAKLNFFKGTVEIGKSCVFTVVVSNCIITIEGPQSGLLEVKFQNVNTGKGSFEGIIEAGVEGIVFKTNEGSICKTASIPGKGKGTYTGKVVEKGVIVE